MRKYTSLFIIFTLFILQFSLSSTANAIIAPPQISTSNRLIIRFQSTTSEKTQDDILKQFSILKKEKLKLPHTVVINLPQGKGKEMIQQFLKFPHIQYAEMDAVANSFDTPNDTSYSSQWGLQKIQAPAAWETTHGSAQTTIAIVDSGIDAGHPDLSSHITARANFTTDPDLDNNGHGSHVAGIAGAVTNNSTGISGVGYNTSLLSVKVLDSTGSGYYSWIANGIIWAADNGAKVINLSLGGTSPSTTLKSAIEYAANKGAVIVAAAGNNYGGTPTYPANYPQVISVGATHTNEQKPNFSTFGSWVTIAAPGVSILSTYKGGYSSLSGSSMSTPFVSGVAALVQAVHPGWSNTQIRSKIETSADKTPGSGTYWKFGRVNACAAVDCTSSMSTVTPTPTQTITPSPTLLPSPTSTPSITLTPSPIPTATLTPIPTVTSPPPTPTKPWWCTYASWSIFCK